MAHRHQKIIVHRPDPNSEADSSTYSSDDAEVAEIAEIMNYKYSKKQSYNSYRAHQKRSENRQKRLNMMANDIQSLSSGSRRSSSSSLSSQEFPIFRILNPDRSPPMFRSHYLEDDKDSKASPTCAEIFKNNALRHEKPGFRDLTTRSRTSSNASDSSCENQARRHRRSHSDANMKIMKSPQISPMVPIGPSDFIGVEGGEAAIGGLQKILKNLNFAERIRQQRIEQQRLDIYNLPPHMKQQLKNIYVY